MAEFIGALDQGTTSTRFMIFDREGREVARAQEEHRQILPRPGWVEHDPAEILHKTDSVIGKCLLTANIAGKDLAGVGITNQRETTVVWHRSSGVAAGNAIVWQDMRTADLVNDFIDAGKADELRQKTGLPPSTYFSAFKLQWMLRNSHELNGAAGAREFVFGTIDSWLIAHLTGGLHVTDVTNASRTCLMNLRTLSWDDSLLRDFAIPAEMLPAITSSSEIYGTTRKDGPFGAEIPVCGNLGDQQAALLGQSGFKPGAIKNTYGTGNFLLLNTGIEPGQSSHGLLSTCAFQRRGEKAFYALEGSVAVTGSAVQWLRDQIGIIGSAAEIESLARSVDDCGGVYFVPAFSGLFAPYWRTDARGIIAGLTRHSTRAHIARAALEAICYQTRDVVDAMTADAGVKIESLNVDGGATVNDMLMQLQSDILGIPVIRPVVIETTALGAAYAAGLACGFWKNYEELQSLWKIDKTWEPRWSADQREEGHAMWKKAIERASGWIE